MSAELRRLLTTTAIAVGGAAIALAFPFDRALVGEALLLVLGGIALLALVRYAVAGRAGRGGRGVPLATLLRRRRESAPPEGLKRLEDRLALAQSTAADYHRLVRPLLRDAAARRLRSRHRIDAVAEPDRARALLGDDVWELLAPNAPVTRDLRAPGARIDQIARALDAIERIRS